MEKINLLISFVAGVTSFFSPCILPVLPGYILYLSGMTMKKASEEKHTGKKYLLIFLHAILFVAGFSLIFILLGASATLLGFLLRKYMSVLIKLAGIFIILLGAHLTGILRIPLLDRGYSAGEVKRERGFFTSFLAGIFFSFGWTPCISPVLAGILTLASQEETVFRGMLLLTFYSCGMGIPLIVLGIVAGTATNVLMRFSRHTKKFEISSGILLIFIGILLISGKLKNLF